MPTSRRMRLPFNQLISSGGDGTGTTNFITDTSITPITGFFQAPAGNDAFISRIQALIVTNAEPGVGYGITNTALTNGIIIQLERTPTKIHVLSTVSTNLEWNLIASSSFVSGEFRDPPSTRFIQIYRFDIGGDSILVSERTDRFEMIFNDDFSVAGLGLTDHLFEISGQLSPNW